MVRTVVGIENNKKREKMIAIARNKLIGVQDFVDHAIAMTPTGEKRNKLTDANIHILAAQRILGEVM